VAAGHFGIPLRPELTPRIFQPMAGQRRFEQEVTETSDRQIAASWHIQRKSAHDRIRSREHHLAAPLYAGSTYRRRAIREDVDFIEMPSAIPTST
jgi:hypothetical protein